MLIYFPEKGYDLERLKPYENFLLECKQKDIESYAKHKHHILPVFMGGGNEIDNFIELTPEDHYNAHLILAECFEKGSDECRYNIGAANLIIKVAKKGLKKVFGGEIPVLLDEFWNQANLHMKDFLKGENNPMWGRKGLLNPNYGRKLSEDQKNNISVLVKERWKNQEWVDKVMVEVYSSEGFKKNISNAQKNNWKDEKVRQNHANSQTVELKKVQSNKMKKRWENEDFRNLMYNKRSGENSVNYGKEGTFRGKSHKDDTKQQMSESAKKSWTKERRDKASKVQSLAQKGLGEGFNNNKAIVIHDIDTGVFYMTRKLLFMTFKECKMTNDLYNKFVASGRFVKIKKKDFNNKEVV